MKIKKRPGDRGTPYRLRFPEDELRQSWLPMLLDAYAIIDQGVNVAIKREEKRRNVTLACEKGCDHCCHTHQDIPLYPLEMVGIYWFVIEKIMPPEREILKVQLLNYEKGASCPFLIKSTCAIHLLRPVSCRQFNVFNRPCDKGEDPYYTRREDVLTPLQENTDQAFFTMLPFYGITTREDRLKAIQENIIHSQVCNLKSCDWKSLGRRIEDSDKGEGQRMSLKGELESMSIADVFQWIEMNRKTGVLAVGPRDFEKYFCFRDGKVAFVSSKKEGERLGEFLSKYGQVDEEKMKEALFRSGEEGVPFTRYLMDKRIVPREFLIVAISQLAETLFRDILTWEQGVFEFSDGLPDIIANGPVFINTGYVVFESIRKHDELMKGKGDLEGL